jgi:hypothetical protein
MSSERTRTNARDSASATTAGAARKVKAIGHPGASHERAADRMADQVSAGHATAGGALSTQRMSNDGADRKSVPVSVERTLARSGTPLEPSLRNGMEHKFGHNFAHVRVHTDASAAQSAKDVSANAYTVGSQIAFAQNQYVPQSGRGRRLIAHELAHVVQGSANAHQGILMRQPADKDAAPSGGAQTQVAQTDPCTDADPQLPSYSAKEEKERNAILQDMLRETTAEQKKAYCKKIRRALAAFSIGQMRAMKKAGVRFWEWESFPPSFGSGYAPKRKGTDELARYDYHYRVIHGLDSGGVDELRHELAHAWDHVRGGKVQKLDKLKGSALDKQIKAEPKFSSETKEKRVTFDDPAGSGTKKVKLSVQDTYDRFMGRPVQGNWSFANSRTKPEHVTGDIREFYAEAYSVFHGDNKDAQADLLCAAPELYQLLEDEALKDKLKVPVRADLETINKSYNRKCT